MPASSALWPQPCTTNRMIKAFCIIALATLPLAAQVNNAPPPGNDTVPIFRAQVVSRSVAAISYRNRSGWTKVDFQGTALAPAAKGNADVNSRKGYIQIKADVKGLSAPVSYGAEYLTYVLWAITPDGHSANLGELLVDENGNAKIDVTTELQSFGLIVTAEPYFAVRQPSDVVVMENIVRQDTMGKVETIDAKYELLQRGQYIYQAPASLQKPVRPDKNMPLEYLEAENAIQVARYAKADHYAADTYNDAVKLLNQAQAYMDRKAGVKPVTMTSREAVQKAEDARVISLKRQQEEALANERQSAADREAAERAKAQQAALDQQKAEQQARLDVERRQAAEADRIAAEREKLQADAARAEADRARTEAERARADADRARAEADANAQKATQSAEEADRLRQQAVTDKENLRHQLLQQFNAILETRETVRGLVVNMNDVLFDTGKYTLKQPAREKLARLAGIILSHPGLNLEVEGYTDSTGGDELNQKLSEQRAAAVKNFLIDQGLPSDALTSEGLGKQFPVASNDTAPGRQLNRRVEMVVSGEVIGVKIGQPPTMGQPLSGTFRPLPQR